MCAESKAKHLTQPALNSKHEDEVIIEFAHLTFSETASEHFPKYPIK